MKTGVYQVKLSQVMSNVFVFEKYRVTRVHATGYQYNTPVCYYWSKLMKCYEYFIYSYLTFQFGDISFCFLSPKPAENKTCWANGVSMLGHRLRRWHSIDPPLVECMLLLWDWPGWILVVYCTGRVRTPLTRWSRRASHCAPCLTPWPLKPPQFTPHLTLKPLQQCI